MINRRLSDRLSVDILENGKRRLRRALRYCIDNRTYCAPEGFETDYSSFPALTRAIVRFDRVDSAGTIHDCLYQTGRSLGRKVTRAESDMVWRKVAVLGEHGANAAQAWTAWIGLRLGGWVVWNKYRRAEKQK